MIEKIEGIDGKMIYRYHASDKLPNKIRYSSDKIKGSDGAERTMAQWWDHIIEKTAYADSDDTLPKELVNLQSALDRTLRLGGDPKDIEDFRVAAGEYFKASLLDCMEKGVNKESIIERLKTKAESLSRSLANAPAKKRGRFDLGCCLLSYIEKHHDLPRTRDELQQFSRTQVYQGNGEIPMRTISDHLPWYGLEKICATYHKD